MVVSKVARFCIILISSATHPRLLRLRISSPSSASRSSSVSAVSAGLSMACILAMLLLRVGAAELPGLLTGLNGSVLKGMRTGGGRLQASGPGGSRGGGEAPRDD